MQVPLHKIEFVESSIEKPNAYIYSDVLALTGFRGTARLGGGTGGVPNLDIGEVLPGSGSLYELAKGL